MITVTILTKNSQKHIASVLRSVECFDEVVVLDSGSIDDTLSIAENFSNVRIYRHEGEFLGFGPMHRKAVELAKNDWILSIDSDEVLSSELQKEIASLSLDARTVYAMPFHNYFNGRHITTCGWYPDRHERLFNRKTTNFSDSFVHEKVQTQGLSIMLLKNPVLHYSYDTIEDFLRKMQSYSTLFAQQNIGKKHSSPTKAWTHGIWAFIKSFVFKRGFTQGYEGFTISAYNAHTAFWKYMKLYEANKKIGQ